MKSVIFLAPPAAGKGTYSNYLIKKFAYQPFSTGDILRKRALQDENLSAILASGKLVDDDLILEIIESELQNLDEKQAFIFDGVPRTLYQAEELDKILNSLNRQDYVVVYIDVAQSTLKDRIVGRRVCPNCHRSYNVVFEEFKPQVEDICDDCGSALVQRKDDNLESFESRLLEYKKSTYPLKDYYEKQGKLYRLEVLDNQESTLKHLEEILK